MNDPFGRRIDYLRLSVTDRCNLRCVYCLPEDYAGFSRRDETLADDEIVVLAERFAELGFSKIRVTGGEPLVRPGLPGLIGRLSAISGVTEISMSTNGILLAPMAKDLARAGLNRVNISLDTLDAAKFAEITRFGTLTAVMEGIAAAAHAGLDPIKLNVVVVRGVNDGELADFAELARERPVHVRFIELMPMGETGFFSAERLVPMAEILGRLGSLEVLPQQNWPAGNGPARYFQAPGAKGTVGIISAMSCTFCGTCNRVRLSAKGALVPCLDGADGTDLAAMLRAGASPEDLRRAIESVIRRKPERHFMLEKAQSREENPRFMCQIGG